MLRKRSVKGQIFSIDALIATSLFLVMLLIFFFFSDLATRNVQAAMDAEDLEQTAFFVSSQLLAALDADEPETFLQITQQDCGGAGMFSKDMSCYVILRLANGSVYGAGSSNQSKVRTAVIPRLLAAGNQTAFFITGVQR